MIQKLINKARNKFPISIWYTGQLSEKEIAIIEKVCDIKCSSVYMDGSATYKIKYKRKGIYV